MNRPPPSPMTVPAASASKGRTASAGESLWDSLRRLSRDWRIMPMGLTLVSAPPQMARSASPRWMVRKASPIARWRGGIGAGDGVAGALEFVNDRHVAGEHVGQIFQQPERRELAHAVRPHLVADRVDCLRRAAVVMAPVSSFRSALIRPAPMLQPKRLPSNVGGFGVGLGFQAGIFERVVGGDDGQLDVAGHHLGGFAVALGDVIADFVSAALRRRSGKGSPPGRTA